MNTSNMAQVLELIAKAQKAPLPEALQKSWVQSASATSGLTAYDLEAGAKHLFPVLTPLRNIIPRVGGGVGTAVNWRAVTGINTNLMEIGVSEGNRGGIMAHTTADYTAAYRGIGLEDNVTFEADYAGRTFEDIKAEAVRDLLSAMMIAEEIILLGGDTSLGLGVTPTPTLSASATGGTIGSITLSVICVALTMSGVYSASVANGVRGQVTRTNADGSTDTYGGGSAQRSTAATVAVTGPTGSVTAVCGSAGNGVNGAMGYAWFWGTAGAETLGAITTLNSVVITTAAGAGTQLASAIPNGGADNSRNNLVFDGILTQVFTPGSGSYILRQPTGTGGTGTPLTPDGAGGIVEFENVLKNYWDQYKLSPDTIWVSSREQSAIQSIIMKAGNNAAQRFVFNVQQNKIMGGTVALSYLNRYGLNAGDEYGQGKEIPIRIHPNLPAGTVLFTTKTLPYKLNNVPNVIQVKTRQEYYQLEWPLRTRKYEYGVYADEVLQNYYPPAFAVITNIGPPSLT